jgi:hypothetical protein
MKDNKLISEFMGDYNFEHTEGGLPIGDFSNSWDWLMPVVSKCFKTGDDTHEWDNIMDTLFTCDRDIVYAQVVEFINQYNKNK